MHPFEALFNEFEPLAKRFEHLRTIVQNPVAIPDEQHKEWEQAHSQVLSDMRSLLKRTKQALQENPNG